MALSAAIAWEVRPTGNNANGGAFKAGASGTDRSQQDAAQWTGTNLTVDASVNTRVLPDGHTPDAADVGNVIQIQAGAGWTAGFYEITGVTSGKWDLDRSPAATGTSGGTWALGGALAHPSVAIGAVYAGNTVWVKGPEYVGAMGTENTDGAYASPISVIGYTTTRGDGTFACVRVYVASVASVIIGVKARWLYAWFDFDAADLGPYAYYRNGTYSHTFVGCQFRRATMYNIAAASYGAYLGCRVTDSAAGATGGVATGTGYFFECLIDANQGYGVGSNNLLDSCVIRNNSGAGVSYQGAQAAEVLTRSVLYNNGSHGLVVSYPNSETPVVIGNIFAKNGGYGIDYNTYQPFPGWAFVERHNAFWNNTSGVRSAAGKSATDDVILTGDPFVDAANGDFRLNALPGAGAACRARGYPDIPGLPLGVGFLDLGAYATLAGLLDYPALRSALMRGASRRAVLAR